MDIEKRYKLLRVISTIFKVVAWIVLILGLLASTGALVLSLSGGLLSANDMGMIAPRLVNPMVLGVPAFLGRIVDHAVEFLYVVCGRRTHFALHRYRREHPRYGPMARIAAASHHPHAADL